MKPARCLMMRAVFVASLLAAAASVRAADEGPWRVLAIYSYGRDFQPHASVAAEFRRQLARRATQPLEFNEVSLDTARLASSEAHDDKPLTQYLLARFAQDPPKLIVTIGKPAATFFLANRALLFPSTPALIGGIEARMLEELRVGPLDVPVAARYDLIGTMNTILALRPGTRRVMIVLGASAPEERWREVFQKEYDGFADRIAFSFTNDLTLDEMRAQAAHLQRDTAILYVTVQVDAAGVPHEGDAALEKLHEVAPVPIFGFSDNQLGRGIVGGPLMSLSEVGREVADAALHVLAGARPSTISVPEIVPTSFQFDWRELERWGISEFSLPPDSIIRYRTPTLWEQHSVLIISGLLIILVQTLLITALGVQSGRRQRAERAAHDLNKRLMSAAEDEKRRLARELHDDFSHRLARLSLDAALLDRALMPGEAPRIMQGMREQISCLSEDMHAVAHQLHPAILEDLGLAEALRTEGDLLARTASLDVTVDVNNVPRRLPPEVALCAFRIAQEALQNVNRHAQASAVGITLRTVDGHLYLAVRDNGVGFDPGRRHNGASLGHASMRERVSLVGGTVNIRSHPGLGTTIETQIPLAETAA
jgi:signal transduction histidine kinase